MKTGDFHMLHCRAGGCGGERVGLFFAPLRKMLPARMENLPFRLHRYSSDIGRSFRRNQLGNFHRVIQVESLESLAHQCPMAWIRIQSDSSRAAEAVYI